MYNIGKLGIVKPNLFASVESVEDLKKVSHNYLGDKGKKSSKKLVESVELVEDGGRGREGIDRKEWNGNERSIECRYGGERRPVHPAVCELHRMEMDRVCRESRCPRMSLGWGGKKKAS